MDFRKLLDDTQTAVDRILQATNEVFGRSEKTEYDAEFVQLCSQAEVFCSMTKKIIGSIENWVNPNPARRFEEIGNRLENLLSDRKNYRLTLPSKSPTECLGDVLLSASVDVGRKHPYGQALKKCGEYYRSLAEIENERNRITETQFLVVLFQFLQYDWVDLQNELRKLQAVRLDYDTARNKLKRDTQPDPEFVKGAEKLREDFEFQLNETRKKLGAVKSVQQTHLAALKEFVTAQAHYFSACSEQAEKTVSFFNQLTESS